MSQFVIMEIIGGCGHPVATRTSGEVAKAYCAELAKLCLRESKGTVESVEDGARYSSEDVSYVAIEVEDCG